MANVTGQITPSIAAEGGDTLDGLFDAIFSQQHDEVRKILREHPGLVDCFNRYRPESPQCLFRKKRFEYILTQDILRRDDEIVVTEICHQKPLHLACIIGDIATVEVLLEQEKVDVYAKNSSQETCFSLACRSGNLHTAWLLLNRGFKMSPDVVDDDNNSPLDYLIYRGIYPEWTENPPENQFEILEKLVQRFMDGFPDPKSKGQLLRSVTEEGNLPMVEAVLKAWWPKPDVNAVDEDGWTALHLAVFGGHKDIVKRLLNKGANPNTRTNPTNANRDGQIAIKLLRNSDTALAGLILNPYTYSLK